MRRLPLLLIAAALAPLPVATLVSTAADAAKRAPAQKQKQKPRRAPAKRRPAAPGPRFSAAGTITVRTTVRTRCAGPGGKGYVIETAGIDWEHSLSGSGRAGSGGELRSRIRRRASLLVEVEDNELGRPGYSEGPWVESSASADFGRSVYLDEGRLFVDLNGITGRRERKGVVRPVPGGSAKVDFNGLPTARRFEPGTGCFEASETVQVSGVVTVTNEG